MTCPHLPKVSDTEWQALLAPDRAGDLPLVVLELDDASREAHWVARLAAVLAAESEVRLPFGRADLVTASYAVEVDWVQKWKEGIGQAKHYARKTGKPPALVLILTGARTLADAYTRGMLAEIAAMAADECLQVFLVTRAPIQQAVMRR